MQEINPDAKLTICYSRPRNIQDVLAKAALFEPEGTEVKTTSLKESYGTSARSPEASCRVSESSAEKLEITELRVWELYIYIITQ